MGDTKWTKEQWEAITEKDGNLLVAAAAGAGKTAVLVERIIRKITDPEHPVDIDRLLVVTFTNAAAAEMRERIGQAVSQALEENPRSKHLQRQLILMNKAHITTIHSFCLDVIRNNFQLLNIDPNFRIADDTEAVLMKWEVLEQLFEDVYEEENPDPLFFDLLESYGGNRDDQVLLDMVMNLYKFIQSSPWPNKWLEEMTESFNQEGQGDFGETPWGKVLLEMIDLELSGMQEMMESGIKILSEASGLTKNLPVFQEDLSFINSLKKICRSESTEKWDTLCRNVHEVKYRRLLPAGKDGDSEKHEQAKKLRDAMKKRMEKIKDEICAADSHEVWHDFKTLYPLMKCLAELVMKFGREFAAKKSRKGILDFNDLEHFCLEVLSHPDGPVSAYRERFQEIYVDEYQDSNLVQELIIKMISRIDEGNPNVFMVGDVKQSIYRFRQAKPELFLEKYHSYSSEKGRPFRKILLYKNFRSRKEILDGVNFLFKSIMSKSVGELDYTDDEALKAGAVYAEPTQGEPCLVGGEVELHLLETGDQKNLPGGGASEDAEKGDGITEDELTGLEEEELLDKIQWEARLVAKRIQQLMQTGVEGNFHVWDRETGKYRPLEYKDIVILMRATQKWSEVFTEELASHGIPTFADTGTGFFKSVEIQVILSLLQIIDNPQQDIPLLAVLRSPIVSFSTNELAELRLVNRRGTIFDALQGLAGQDRLQRLQGAKKAGDFLQKLNKWRDMSQYLTTDRLIWYLYQDTGYFSLVGAMPNGEQRQANLRILFERARQFEATSYKGLFNFINFVDKLRSSQGDMGAAKILGANHNVVRIMSIHKSKGLEFPVVILSGCGKKFNLQDLTKKILLHQDLGLGPDFVDLKLRLSYPSLPKLAIREKIRRETLSEEMRILYVALTRAKEKLIITGGVADLAKALEKWTDSSEVGEILPPYKMIAAGNYLDWLVPALLRHKDGCGLREMSGLKNDGEWCPIDDPSMWQIKLWSKKDLGATNSLVLEEEDQFMEWLDHLGTGNEESFSTEISQRLSWAYQYQKVAKFPAKVSVTELKRWFEEEISEGTQPFPEYPVTLVKKPLFLQEKKGLSRAEAGTVMHFVMQHLDFHHDDIESQIWGMVEKHLLTPKQAEVIETGKIRDFLLSPLGERLLASPGVYREVPFFMEIPCSELYPELANGPCLDEKVLLQGVVDCYFEEADGLVLVDYKTDYVPEGGSGKLRERYRSQISYYARALEMLTGKRVKEKYIYLFSNQEILVY
jgi:ATP-dependent helicase/nuclease subunit A